MELLIVVLIVAALVVAVRAGLDAPVARRVLPVLLAAFAARLAAHVMLKGGALFDYGGDNVLYDLWAQEIADQWKRDGISYVTVNGAGRLYGAALHCNLLALLRYICDGPVPLASAALMALLACLLCVVMYRFARMLGADDRGAFWLLVVVAFMPGFLLHTSDSYKDGVNALLVVASLAVGVSLTRRCTLGKLLTLVPLLWALWNIRPYMAFMCVLPLALGISGLRQVVSLRSLVVLTALAMVVLFRFDFVMQSEPIEAMRDQLEYAQSPDVQRSNAGVSGWRNGSGVGFEDDGSPWGALGAKLVYTLLSPFPWTPGSLALQLGKIDTCLWYLLLCFGLAGGRRLWRRDRRTLLILLLFLVPSALAYATTMANIGLIARQRIPLVMVTSLLCALAWSRTPSESQDTPEGGAESPPEPERTAAVRS
ncbi:hypothetical protein Ssi03_12450 [Sphaerisporangium siamense]|uniref:Glycosyltransferase RgtA/B/C/D-like domain-containing protein n=1 Tax=Sphaerisporangium siamense TaxID=795645 RepID=A0A7W7GBM4_9ACTN|nr:hypothetical protein [Sphaerisporangium siamense]MBB4702985.1 hypothetical protein [Sphaerisporangium siamense]GII83255.1 hypothetical protein Ssi03_12450 [Sphaerisporangium siamense]